MTFFDMGIGKKMRREEFWEKKICATDFCGEEKDAQKRGESF